MPNNYLQTNPNKQIKHVNTKQTKFKPPTQTTQLKQQAHKPTKNHIQHNQLSN